MTDPERHAMILAMSTLLTWREECPNLWDSFDDAAIEALSKCLAQPNPKLLEKLEAIAAKATGEQA